MRVLIVIPTYYPATVYGGPTFSIHLTAAALARAGVDVRVSTTDANRPGRLDVDTRVPVQLEPGYQVRYYREVVLDRLSFDFLATIDRDVAGCDVVHLQDLWSSYAVATLAAAARHRRPVLISPRGVLSAWALGDTRPLAKQMWLKGLIGPFVGDRRRVAWHATSPGEAGDITRAFPGARVEVIGNGVDLKAFAHSTGLSRDDWWTRFGCGLPPRARTTVTMIAMGRLHRVKGYDIALEALATPAFQSADFRFIVAGPDEGEGRNLQAQAASLGLAGRFGLAGEARNRDKIDFLKGGDVFLFPSRSENFGMAALEALSAGVPVIASRDTPWQVLEDSPAGDWIDNTVPGMADCLGGWLAKPGLGQDGPAASAARALSSSYSIDATAASFIGLFRTLTGRPRSIAAS